MMLTDDRPIRKSNFVCCLHSIASFIVNFLVFLSLEPCPQVYSGTTFKPSMKSFFFLQRGVPLLLVLCLFSALSWTSSLESADDSSMKDPRFTVHGNWCGPDHGGFQDCCGGRPCPSCNIPEPGQFGYQMNMTACFAECPPLDLVDFACVWHDACTYVSGKAPLTSCGHWTKPESCFCNCVMSSICHLPSQSSLICDYFEDVASCWFCEDDGEAREEPKEEDAGSGKRSQELKCDQWDSYNYPLDYFCSDGVSVLSQFAETGYLHMEQDIWNHSCYFGPPVNNNSTKRFPQGHAVKPRLNMTSKKRKVSSN